MSEFLTVRLSRKADSQVQWLVWSASQQEIIASGELASRKLLQELTPYANQRSVVVLLDSCDVLLTEASIPAGASRQLDTMLPYLLEEDIAQDVDDLHFSVLKKSGGVAQVAAVEKRYLEQLLDDFAQAGMEVKRVMPDVYALPLQEAGITALQIGSQWLMRKSAFAGIVVEQEWLSLLLDSDWCRQEDSPAMVYSYTPVPDLDEPYLGRWQALEPEVVMVLLAKGAMASPVNLLTGGFKPQSSLLKHIRVWRKAALAACLFFIILLAQQMIEVHQAESLSNAYREESERIFRTVFPDRRKIPTVSYLKRQMNSEATRLGGGASQDSALSWLSELAASLANTKDVQFSTLRYDAQRGEIRVDVNMKDFQSFEVLRSQLAERFSVSQGPLDRDGDRVTGSYTLRSKP
ncbi:type II secretion system protein GspL [Vibrio albus]|uniref:Type II secretion system protein L n=1 Tax=Vibrio albus TaxID=2200953 RepID=A0A2U3B851_9VIBR|nr:type II secretion system protein GspL [Vibrio albus]PWI32968.1 type II secretion system protein GspL [Vibrio albus]